MKIVWNQNALDSLDKNIEYLKKRWSVKEVADFLEIVDSKVLTLQKNPHIGTICEFKPLLRQLVITKHVTLFYEVEPEKIYLHLFWLNFQNPEKLKMLIS